MAGLIAALPDLHWTAVKITQYGHGICSTEGHACDCAGADPDHPFALTQESDPAGKADSSRYLAAGADRSYWLRTAAGNLGNALPALHGIIRSSENVIFESNSVLQFFTPDVYLLVADFAIDDFKPSSLKYLDRADALVVVDRKTEHPLWRGVSHKLWETKKRFCVKPPQYVTEAIAAFVRGRLTSSATPSGSQDADSSGPEPAGVR
ncbi:MAG TPA: hypothetical protein VJN43_05805 [Bryobacteraceae bacterium]|nr:hypothetical protein [Bryobacteraceae bacterium]